MALDEKENQILRSAIFDYLKVRSKPGDAQNEALDTLKLKIRKIRPKMEFNAITAAIYRSEPESTISLNSELQDLEFHIQDMLKNLNIWLDQ